jgi:hypothetical protein
MLEFLPFACYSIFYSWRNFMIGLVSNKHRDMDRVNFDNQDCQTSRTLALLLYSHNLGNIGSQVKVDGIPVANLDVKLSMINGALDYEKHSVANVTEIYKGI